MPTPVPFADDGGTPAWRVRHALHSAPRFPIWRFLLALAALPFLLAFMAAASWLAWMCFEGVMGPPGAIIALVGIAAPAALIRRHTGMALGCRAIARRCGGASRTGVGCVRAGGVGVG
jgi:hypothetical protein